MIMYYYYICLNVIDHQLKNLSPISQLKKGQKNCPMNKKYSIGVDGMWCSTYNSTFSLAHITALLAFKILCEKSCSFSNSFCT